MSSGQGSREKKDPDTSGEFPKPKEAGGRGTGTPGRGKASAGQRGRRGRACRGPPARMGGAMRQQVCVTWGARLGRLELAWVLGQLRGTPRGGRLTSLGL